MFFFLKVTESFSRVESDPRGIGKQWYGQATTASMAANRHRLLPMAANGVWMVPDCSCLVMITEVVNDGIFSIKDFLLETSASVMKFSESFMLNIR
jgi:hypothetical protein